MKSSSSKINNVLKSFNSIEPNTLFIKSIDEVQGEERDIIIFGITYGNNVHNYMLLSDEYARNKINVAITRARQRIIIVKSHKSSEYCRINTHNEYSGPETLFKFLAYAENIKKNGIESVTSKDLSRIDNDFLDYLKKKKYDVIKIINIRNKNFFIVNNKEKLNAYFVVDEHSMTDARNEIWFYESLFNSRGYVCKPILITDLYKINI